LINWRGNFSEIPYETKRPADFVLVSEISPKILTPHKKKEFGEGHTGLRFGPAKEKEQKRRRYGQH